MYRVDLFKARMASLIWATLMLWGGAMTQAGAQPGDNAARVVDGLAKFIPQVLALENTELSFISDFKVLLLSLIHI